MTIYFQIHFVLAHMYTYVYVHIYVCLYVYIYMYIDFGLSVLTREQYQQNIKPQHYLVN